ncbi:hypothetical protein Hanom_Chr03g00196561 [Helianthus anomalus]
MKEEIEKEKLLRKRKRLEMDDDAPYVPSPEHVTESQSTPKGRRKAGGKKKATPKIRVPKRPQKIVQKKQPEKESEKSPTPPHDPTPPQSPIHQSPPRQPTPPQHSSPHRLPTPPNQPFPNLQTTPPQQPFVSSQDIFGTPPLSQIQPGSSSKGLHSSQDNLLDVGVFDFANTSQVMNVERKIEEVVAENKRLAVENKKIADIEKLLAARVQKLEGPCV